MTRSRRMKVEEPVEAEEPNSQFSVSRQTARLQIEEDTPMPELSATDSFVEVSNHGFHDGNGMMTPMSSFSVPVGSMAPSNQERGVHLVGKEAMVLVDAINDFRKCGVDHVVQLPELVLVGDQSAGKSSLMGALTEIHLPRASGICTRCPALIKTSEAPVWTCKVSLHREYRYVSQGGRQVTKDRPLPPWEKQALNVSLFKTIQDKRDLEEVLKWAQIAILNDSKDYGRYIPGSSRFANDTTTEAKFSPNVVSIEICGPALPSLSFYDLPGIFANTSEKEDQYLIKVIENLAKMYIKRKRALIICAIPMAMDPALSRTRKVITDCGAEDRCVGVLTMADRLQDGQTHTDYEKILRGQAHDLGEGYFITKLPGGSSSGVYDPNYHEKARLNEERFFDNARPWSSEWREFRERCGTTKLQYALSHKFAAEIKRSVPDMESKIKNRQRELDRLLENLPELPSTDVFYMVIQHLGIFTTDMQKILDGGANHNAFQCKFSELCDLFRKAVLDMKPQLVLSHPSDKVQEVIEIESDEEMSGNAVQTPNRPQQNGDSPVTLNGNRKHPHPDPGTPTPLKRKRPVGPGQLDGSQDRRSPMKPKQEIVDGLPVRFPSPNMMRASAAPSVSTGEISDKDPFGEILRQHQTGRHNNLILSIASIHKKIQEHTKTGLIGVVSPQVYTDLCLKSVQPWKIPMQRLLECTVNMLRENAEAILKETFKKYTQTQIYQQSREHLSRFFDGLEDLQRQSLNHLCDLEAKNDFTVNKPAFDLYKQEEGDGIRKGRRAYRARLLVGQRVKEGKIFKTEEGKKAEEKKAESELPPDKFKVEIEVAAYVRGYYKTAALRFVDSVCLSIHGKLFQDVRDNIPFYLEKNFHVYDADREERCRELLEEDAEIAEKRRDYKREKESLTKFTTRLMKLANDTAALEAGSGSRTHQAYVEDSEDII